MYEKINPAITNITIKTFLGYVWYFTLKTAALTFFHKIISIESKRKMVQLIQNNNFDSHDTNRLNI